LASIQPWALRGERMPIRLRRSTCGSAPGDRMWKGSRKALYREGHGRRPADWWLCQESGNGDAHRFEDIKSTQHRHTGLTNF
jgi:hypothetical protein